MKNNRILSHILSKKLSNEEMAIIAAGSGKGSLEMTFKPHPDIQPDIQLI